MGVVWAHDASWGGWGQALATERGPVAVGWRKLKGRRRRWSALSEALALDLLTWPIEAELRRTVGDSPPRVAVERPGSGSKVNKGNQADIGSGLGSICGPILVAGARPGWLEPWWLRPTVWRPWWNLKGPREQVKADAIRLVCGMGWGRWLHGLEPDAAGDVAEAILIAVGVARHPEQAPIQGLGSSK